MLPKHHRIVRAADFRRIVRTGRRSSSPTAIASVLPGATTSSRFGFIVSKKVGNAVVRNRVRRRMSEALRGHAVASEPVDVVIRALPAAATADFDTLATHITSLLRSR